MKPNVKEILKNKSNKMVDLIIDEIGASGDKSMCTSFVDDSHKDVKYQIEVKIKSGDPDNFDGTSDSELISMLISRIELLENRVSELEG